eukprot:6203505-Pleurochrysis_carterae.AAC.1
MHSCTPTYQATGTHSTENKKEHAQCEVLKLEQVPQVTCSITKTPTEHSCRRSKTSSTEAVCVLTLKLVRHGCALPWLRADLGVPVHASVGARVQPRRLDACASTHATGCVWRPELCVRACGESPSFTRT